MSKIINHSLITIGNNNPRATYNTANFGNSLSTTLNTIMANIVNLKRTTIHLLDGVYTMTGNVDWKDNITLMGSGVNSTKIIQVNSWTNKLSGINYPKIINLTIDADGMFGPAVGAGQPLNGNIYGILVENCIGARIKNVRVINATGFGIFLAAGKLGGITDNCKIIDCYVSGKGISDVIGGGATDASGEVRNCKVINCTVIQDSTKGNGHKDAMNFVKANNTTFSDNTTYGSIFFGIEVTPHLDSRISNNTLYSPLGGERSVIGAVVRNNPITNPSAGSGIMIHNNILKNGFIDVFNNYSNIKMDYLSITKNTIKATVQIIISTMIIRIITTF